ncbi:hypothetical protein GW17_00012176 [Ensete ventricosum]|nr:hypothetical protein GW17_00012176 [Ensete ventricosum]RZR97557.1 hypothetical protein BHM03_00026756 [Ensete ventricosum]
MGVAALGWHLQRVGGHHAHRRFARANGLPMGLCLQAAVTTINCPYKQSGRSRPPLQVAWPWVASPTGGLPVGALQANHVSDGYFRNSIYKDALTPLSPSTPSPPPLSLRRRRLPLPLAAALPRGDNPGGRPLDETLAGALQPTPFVGAALQEAVAPTAAMPCWRLPPLPAGLGRGMAVGGRPCMGASRGWPPLLLAAFVVKCNKNA